MAAVLEILALLLVLAALWLLRHKSRELFQWAAIPRRQPRALQVLEQVRLSPNHSVHLVRLGDRVMVVAIHPSGCQLLARTRWTGESMQHPQQLGERA